MKKLTSILILFAYMPLYGNETRLDTDIGHEYFSKYVATQMVSATKKDIENFLTLLTDNVAHTHLPWDNDDTRLANGKEKMREGMLFYLGAHTKYKAKLLNVYTFNSSAIAVRYEKWSEGIHPETGKLVSNNTVYMDVLELEESKIAVIRKYHE